MSILCPNICVSILTLVYRCAYCVLTYLIPAVQQNALQTINVSELLTIQRLLQSTPHWKVNCTEVLTIRWPVFRVDKTPVDESARKQLRDVNVVLIAITPFDTTALAKDI